MTTLSLRDLGFIAAGQAAPAAADPNFANVSLLLHCEGANGSTTILDNSPSPKTLTASGGVAITTAFSRFGSSALGFDGISGAAITGTSADFNLSGNFTIEYWVKQIAQASNGVHLNVWASSTDKIVLAYIAGQGIYYLLNGNVVITSTSFPFNTWTHVALCRNGSTTTLYRDGTSIGTTTASPLSSSKLVELGRDQTAAFLNGQLDEVRITKGVARYTANFTPPTAAFPDA